MVPESGTVCVGKPQRGPAAAAQLTTCWKNGGLLWLLYPLFLFSTPLLPSTLSPSKMLLCKTRAHQHSTRNFHMPQSVTCLDGNDQTCFNQGSPLSHSISLSLIYVSIYVSSYVSMYLAL